MSKEVFYPSARYGYILDGVLLAILFISLISFPTNVFSFRDMSPDDIKNQEAIFKIGWPVTFFEIDLLDMGEMPIKIVPFILSLIGYLFFAYFVDVCFSLIVLSMEKPPTRLDILTQARKAYFYRKSQGLEDTKIREQFKQKGWRDVQISSLLK